MAKNIINYLKTNQNIKALIWAHNAHIKYFGHHKNEKPMGMFLRKSVGANYFAIAQFFGCGTLSATIIHETDPDSPNRSLIPVVVNTIPNNFLESKLHKIDDQPYYLDNLEITKHEIFNQTYRCWSFGWGLMLKYLDQQIERINPVEDFSLLIYFSEAKHSRPLIRKMV